MSSDLSRDPARRCRPKGKLVAPKVSLGSVAGGAIRLWRGASGRPWRDADPNEEFRGAQLVGETGKGDTFDEAKLKKLTGRDPIRARFMRMDFFEFEATHKLCFAGNHLPALRSGDHAMRRRTRICSFDHPHKTIDRRQADKLKAEGGGILKLLIEAAVKWRTVKLGEPKKVRAATDKSFEAANPMCRWLRERCVLGKSEEQRTADPHADCVMFLKELGEKVPSMRKFVVDLDGVEGVWNEHRRDGSNFNGLRLRGVGERPAACNGEGEAAPLVRVPDWPGAGAG